MRGEGSSVGATGRPRAYASEVVPVGPLTGFPPTARQWETNRLMGAKEPGVNTEGEPAVTVEAPGMVPAGDAEKVRANPLDPAIDVADRIWPCMTEALAAEKAPMVYMRVFRLEVNDVALLNVMVPVWGAGTMMERLWTVEEDDVKVLVTDVWRPASSTATSTCRL